MIALNEVPVSPRTIDDLIPHLEPTRRAQLHDAVDGYDHTRTIWHVSSTAQGGGVAEMLRPLVGYGRALGLPLRWLVLDAPTEFFEITKRIDNGISGVPGDGGPLGYAEHQMYQSVASRIGAALGEHVAAGDRVFLHDPQTAGLAAYVRRAGADAIWRAHNGSDLPNQHTGAAWEFLRAYLTDAQALVFTRPQFAPGWAAGRPTAVIPPLIDPASPKNQPMSAQVADSVLAHCGLLGDRRDQPAPTFTRFDGDTATATLQPLIVHEGPAPHPDTPMIVQVSRWDRVKDMAGVMHGFAEHIAHRTDATLLLIGPEVDGVADDPEAAAVFADCVGAWEALDPHLRRRVQLVCLPMTDPEANAAVVNAAQQHATVAVQKSYSEGFGLTATEAMWKAKPLVTTAVGGLGLQVPDTSVGTALTDPDDLASFGAAVIDYLAEPGYRGEVGRNARASVRRHFLPDAHFLAELALLSDLNEKVRR